MATRYCSSCGLRLAARPPTRCESCGYEVFVDAKPGAAAIVVDDTGRFLAVKRARDPARGTWDVPGGFCDGDHPELAAVREVAEETGLAVTLGGFVGVWTETYSYQGDEFPILVLYYLAFPQPGATLRPNPAEVSEARWFPLSEPPEPLASPAPRNAIRGAATLAGNAVRSAPAHIRVTGVLVEGDKILLLNQDTDNGRAWSLPGGKVEQGETLEAALVREMREETGLAVELRRLLYVCDHFGATGQVVHMSFEVDRVGGTLGDVAGVDSQPIRAVEFVPVVDLHEHGFSETFQELATAGFPRAGSYMGVKANIGL